MENPSDGGFVIKERTDDEPTPDAAAAKEPELLPLRNSGGAMMEKGRMRWYCAKLKELQFAEDALGGLLADCLTEQERVRFGLQRKPLSDWLVAMLLDRHILRANTEGDLPWSLEFVPDARKVVRAAITIVGPVSEGNFQLTSPVQKPKAAAPKPEEKSSS